MFIPNQNPTVKAWYDVTDMLFLFQLPLLQFLRIKLSEPELKFIDMNFERYTFSLSYSISLLMLYNIVMSQVNMIYWNMTYLSAYIICWYYITLYIYISTIGLHANCPLPVDLTTGRPVPSPRSSVERTVLPWCLGFLMVSGAKKGIINKDGILYYTYYRYTPLKTNISPEKWWLEVGRCISYWNSPFFGDMLIFRGV